MEGLTGEAATTDWLIRWINLTKAVMIDWREGSLCKDRLVRRKLQ